MLCLNISGGIMVYPLPLFVKRFILHQDVDVYQVLAPGVGLGGQDPGGVEVAHILNWKIKYKYKYSSHTISPHTQRHLVWFGLAGMRSSFALRRTDKLNSD
jgi:hypothetical protein